MQKHRLSPACLSGGFTRYVLALLLFTTLQAVQAQQPIKPQLGNPITVDLQQVVSEYKERATGRNGRVGNFQPKNKFLQVKGSYIHIEAVAKESAETLHAQLEALGLQEVTTFGRVVSGLFPIEKINQLKSLESLKFVRPAYKPVRNVGVTTSQGDSAQQSGKARKDFGINGAGVKVGIISDSYNALDDAEEGIQSGDLPGPGNPNNLTSPVEVLSDRFTREDGAIDEGRAMAEIIHDVAPGAQLAFYDLVGSEPGFAQGIIELAEAGCDIIVDDIGYFAEPYFQDGIINQAIEEVTRRGVTYFTAAGNSARDSYESDFKPSGIDPGLELFGSSIGEAHDFGNGDIFQKVTVAAGGVLALGFQWADPFFSVSGGAGAATDMDIYILDDSLNLLAAFNNINIGNDPIEIPIYQNEGLAADFNILIVKSKGPNPQRIKYIDFGSGFTIREYATNSSTVYGHSNATSAISVAAARYDRTPAYGIDPPRIEAFSSVGGTPILFDEAGNRIASIIRQKPDITAPNGANTSFFTPDPDLDPTIFDYEGDDFPNFFGTSAAAPHAAAVGALMLDASAKSLSPQELEQVLERTAIDMDNPYTPGFDTGFDLATGYGLIQADRAVAAVVQEPTVIANLQLTSVCSDNPGQARRWRVRNPNAFAVNVSWRVYGTALTGSLRTPPGDYFFTTSAVNGPNTTILSWEDAAGRNQQTVKASGGATCSDPAARVADNSTSLEVDDVLLPSLAQAYPTYFTGSFKLKFLNEAAHKATVYVYDGQGRLAQQETLHLQAGVSEKEIKTAKVAKGAVVVKVYYHQTRTSETFKMINQ